MTALAEINYIHGAQPDLHHVAASMDARARSLREEADALERDAGELRRLLSLRADREGSAKAECGSCGHAIASGEAIPCQCPGCGKQHGLWYLPRRS